jgi:hypothetical protein
LARFCEIFRLPRHLRSFLGRTDQGSGLWHTCSPTLHRAGFSWRANERMGRMSEANKSHTMHLQIQGDRFKNQAPFIWPLRPQCQLPRFLATSDCEIALPIHCHFNRFSVGIQVRRKGFHEAPVPNEVDEQSWGLPCRRA